MPRFVRFRFVREYPLERIWGGVRFRFLLRSQGAELSLIVKKEADPPVSIVLTGTFYGRWWLENDLYRRGFEVEEGTPECRLMERMEREGWAVGSTEVRRH